MLRFQVSIVVILIAGVFSPAAAQSFGSFLYPYPDTVFPQSLTPRIHNDRIYVLKATYELGFSGVNFRTYLDQYDWEGLPLVHTVIDSILPQAYQVVNTQPMLWLADRLLLAMDKTSFNAPGEGQRAIILGMDTAGTQLWKQEFTSGISTSGVLLPEQNGRAFHGNIRSSATSNQDDLAFSLINSDGQIAWTKYIPLPADQQRSYIRVMEGAKIQSKALFLCDYGLLGGTQVGHTLLAVDSMGNFESKDLPAGGQPLIAGRPNSDTFYITESKRVGNHFYYCLHTYVGNFNNLIHTACSDEQTPEASEFEYSMGVGQQGKVYTVGTTRLPGDSISIGHVAQWAASGALLWKKSYRLGIYPKGTCGFNGMDFTVDGNILLSGVANSDYAAAYPLRFTWLLLLDKDGCYGNDCNDLISLNTKVVATLIVPPREKMKFSVYPNPVNTQITLDCPSAGKVRLYDVNGKIKAETAVGTGLFYLPVQNYPTGCYFINFNANDGKAPSVTKKIIIAQ